MTPPESTAVTYWWSFPKMIQISPTIGRARERMKPEPRPAPDTPQPPTAKSDRHPDAVFVDQAVAWDHRLLSWTGRQIATPRRTVRLLSWAFAKLVLLYSKPRGVVVTLASPKVPRETLDERQAICEQCPENDSGYCLACNCPKWSFAKLDRKNRHTKWYCPLMKHPGAYPKYPCPGCGRGRQDAPTPFDGPNTPPMPQRPMGAATEATAGSQRPKSGCGRTSERATIPRSNGQSQEL